MQRAKKQKKGELTLKVLFELVISLLIVVFFVTAANEYASGEAQHKQAIANDLSLLLTELSGVPGDATIFYDQDTSRYLITLEDSQVVVSSGTSIEDDVFAARASFMGKSGASSINQPKQLIIQKTGGALLLKST